jgi:hypothetical protein
MRLRLTLLVVVAVALAVVVSRSAAAPLPKVSNVTAAPTPSLAGHAAKYTIGFRTSPSGALVTGNTITVKFPAGTVPGLSCGAVSAFAANVTVNGVTTSVSSIVSCLEVRVTVPAGAGIGNSSLVTVVMGSSSNVIRNPGAGSYTLKVHTTKDLTDVKSASYTIAAQHQPVANGQSVSTDEDVAKLITLTGSDADGDPLSFFISAVPAHGTLGPIGAPTCGAGVCSADVTYTPAADYNGPDSFKFRVNDGVVNSVAAGATVSIAVGPVADAPVAVDDATTVLQGSGPNTIAVLANDSDADGDTLTITSNSAATNGLATCSTSSCTYDPNGYFGSDSFMYTISDGALTDTATVFVEVTPTGGPASFELCAKTGTATLVGSTTVSIWGFAEGDCDLGNPATLPGPPLTVHAGDTVSITIDNSLAQAVSLELPGQNEPPDPVGTPAGTEKTYTFTAGDPGTFLYESGNNRQTLMGLYGALIVAPATSAYDVEATLVLSEVDPAFNANPAGFNLLNFAPKYWLINGESYPPGTPPPGPNPIVAAAGDDVLLRYVNAGNVHHTMALLGLHQRVVARDGYPVSYPYDVVGETIPAGSTLDTAVALPASGTKSFPLYSRQLHLDNAGTPGGGMLTFLDPQAAPLAAQPATLTLTVGSLTSPTSGERVRISARTVACAPCRATARLRVSGQWIAASMSRVNGRWVATFSGVPRGRWAYQVRVKDVDSGTRLASVQRIVRVS